MNAKDTLKQKMHRQKFAEARRALWSRYFAGALLIWSAVMAFPFFYMDAIHNFPGVFITVYCAGTALLAVGCDAKARRESQDEAP